VSDKSQPSPNRGQIERVSGRSTLGGKRTGLPKVHEIDIAHPDGRRVSARSQRGPASGEERTATGVCVIEAARFPFCPICHREKIPADTDEHVPPKALGGVVMTNTCLDCNNRLGSRTESALQDWYDGAARVHFTSDTSRTPFGNNKVLFLTSETGESVMLMEKPAPTGSAPLKRLNDPNVEAHLAIPRPAEYKTALLKSVYLAACLHFGGVPYTQTVLAAREELLLARDSKSRREVHLGTVAESLRMHRTGRSASGPRLALMRSDHAGATTFLISLAGTVLVEWPFVDLDPMSSPRMRGA